MRQAWTILVVVTVAACGDDGGSSGPVPLEEYVDVLVQTQCERAVRCDLAPDLESCLAARFAERVGTLAEDLAAVEAGTAIYDGEAAAACNEYLEDADCTIVFVEDSPCFHVFEGTVAEGGACASDAECVTPERGEVYCSGACDPNPECCVGTCVVLAGAAVGEGETCLAEDGTRNACQVGLYCAVDDTTFIGTCVPQGGVGDPCFDGTECAGQAYCDFNSGTCVELAGQGEPCDPDLTFPALACVELAEYCDPTTSVCTERRAVGESCAAGEVCARDAFCDGALCQAQGGQGAPCTAESQCLLDLICDGQCIPPIAEPVCPL